LESHVTGAQQVCLRAENSTIQKWPISCTIQKWPISCTIQKWPISSMGLGLTFTGCCILSLVEMGNFISVKPTSFWLIDDCLYSAILCSRADSLCSHVDLHEWLAFYSAFLNIHWTGVLTALTWLMHMKLLPSRHKFCIHYATMLHVTSCKATCVRCMRVYL